MAMPSETERREKEKSDNPTNEDGKYDLMAMADSLYHSTLEGNWVDVVKEYRKDARIHKRIINNSKQTALHVAVNDDQEQIVEQLVDEIKIKGSLSALETGDERGDTPLHCAASRGSLRMCRCIAQGNHQLIDARNYNGETPLYSAALHGRKEAFLYLQSLRNDRSVGLCRRTLDGETVLHCTIRRDYFDLAFQIVHLYKDDIVGSVDEMGITPLHILANKPSAFESSSNFRWYNKLIYRCIIVEPLTDDTEVHISELRQKSSDPFLNCFQFPKSQMAVRAKKQADTEDPRFDEDEHVPPNYWTCYNIFVPAFTCFIWLLFGLFGLKDLMTKRTKHAYCHQILNALWTSNKAYVGGGSVPQGPPIDDESDTEISRVLEFKKGHQNQNGKQNDVHGNSKKDKTNEKEAQNVRFDESKQKGGEDEKNAGDRKESALLVAAKNGVLEILKKILKQKPGAIHETNSQGQNVLHVAVEFRQPHVVELLSKERLWDNLLRGVDNDGNTVLHLAAKLSHYKPWHIPGSALQMQWEIKWFLYIKDLTPRYVPFLPNKQKQTPIEIFRKDHESLVQEGSEWLKSTSESCSVVAALIAGVAFATSTTIPGGFQEETGKPYLERHPAFNMFALTSLLALCCSTTALIMFLAILTSRQQPRDFRKDLPLKLLLGLTSLFVSIASVLVSFSAAFFFVLQDNLKQVVFPLYAATILPISFYAIAQFPLYADLFRAIFRKAPQSSNRESEKLIV